MDEAKTITQTISKGFFTDIIELALLCAENETNELSFDLLDNQLHVRIIFNEEE